MRNLLLPVLLVGAVGLPYLIFQEQNQDANGPPQNTPVNQSANFSMPVYSASTGYPPTSFNSAAQVPHTSQVPAQLASLPSRVVLPGTAFGPDLSSVPMEFLPTTNLQEIIRFDITPAWIKQRWDRVSMTPAQDGLQGMRVALVTGTNASDLHGSLTYQFDNKQSLQRISFQGWTGETSQLVQLATGVFKLKQKPSNLAGLYVASNWRQPKSALLMQHPNVIRSTNPTQQVGIVLEINNPQGSFALSPTVQSMVRSASQ